MGTATKTLRLDVRSVIVSDASYESELLQCHKLRREVFVEEQGVSEDEEWDNLDSVARHFTARIVAADSSYQTISSSTDQPETASRTDIAACARARDISDGKERQIKIERMAVGASHRGQAIGSRLLQNILLHYLGVSDKISLSAQTQAIPFYEKLGFEVNSEEFIDAGITHRKMLFKANTDSYFKVFPSGRWPFNSERQTSNHSKLLTYLTRRDIRIQWADKPWIFKDPAWLDLLSHFIRAHPRASCRILLGYPYDLKSHYPRFARLLNQFPSKLKIKALNDDAERVADSYSTGDQKHILEIIDAQMLAGVLSVDRPASVVDALDCFERNWQHHSEEILELRTLYL